MNPQAEGGGPAPGIIGGSNPKAPGAAAMSLRKVIPRVMNALLWLVCCAMAGTGLLLAFRLPPGSRGGRGLSAMDLSRHEWGDIHTWLSYAFLALIAVHLALHWRWFWQVAARKKRWPLIAGFGAGIALLLALACQPVTKGGDDHDHEQETAAAHRGGRNR